MKKRKTVLTMIPVYIFILFFIIAGSLCVNNSIETNVNINALSSRRVVVIDAGHGGADGGATSCSGVLESKINLEIALKLNDLFQIIGYRTVMIRTDDVSVYTSGNSLAEQKISDLKERTRIVNHYSNSFLVSIHQNFYTENQYSGAQVFYGKNSYSKDIGMYLQSDLVKYLNPQSMRKSKMAQGIYLMEHVERPAVLVECGFLSNPEEDLLLQDPNYQNKLCCVIASSCSRFWKENYAVS